MKSTTITLRGSNPDQVRIYVDGVPLNIAAGGGVDISTLPIGDVERVEVYRGSSPLRVRRVRAGRHHLDHDAHAGRGARRRAHRHRIVRDDVRRRQRRRPRRPAAPVRRRCTASPRRATFPTCNDNGTAFNPADDVMMPRQNNDVQQGDGVLRAALTLSGRRTLNLGVDRVRARRRAAGHGRLPDHQGPLPDACAASAICATSRATTWDRAAGCRRSCSRPLQRDRLDDATDETGLGGRVADAEHDRHRRA